MNDEPEAEFPCAGFQDLDINGRLSVVARVKGKERETHNLILAIHPCKLLRDFLRPIRRRVVHYDDLPS